MGIALASGRRAAAAWLAGGPAAAALYQRALARDLRRPIALAGAIRAAAERPALARLVPPLARIPPLVGLLGRLTRVPLEAGAAVR
jgi:hypothetical protein